MKKYAASVFDRLFDGPAPSGASDFSGTLTEQAIKANVARDIENLLNSRGCSSMPILLDFPNVSKSVYSYGLKDFSAASLESAADRVSICTEIAHTVELHESRLSDVRVSIFVDPGNRKVIKFSVTAKLRLDPAVLPVAFDALFEPLQAMYSVAHE